MKNKKLFIAGERGFVGSNLLSFFQSKNYENIINQPDSLDFKNQNQTDEFIGSEKPDIIILAAGRVGGILANRLYPAQFIYENLMIWLNIIHAAAENEIEKLIFLGSSTVYPTTAEYPLNEVSLFTGPFESNTEPYAFAKLTAIKLCEEYFKTRDCNFISLTLTNLYGPNDHFNTKNAHVLPSLITRFHQAKIENKTEVELWGTGRPTRDFLFVEDLAEAIEFALNNINAEDIYNNGIAHLNVGSGHETSIFNISHIIADTVSYLGEIKFDSSKPDGAMRKILDISRINKLGWTPKTELKDGIKKTYNWYIENIGSI